MIPVPSSLSSTKCVPNSRKANPLNRQTYFQCTENGLALMKCPEKMVFESASSACIRDNSPPDRETPPSCPMTGGYFPSSTSCEGFWQCCNSSPKYFLCPVGLHYNPDPEVSACDWPLNVKSCGARWWSAAKKGSNEITDDNKETKNKRKWGEQ